MKRYLLEIGVIPMQNHPINRKNILLDMINMISITSSSADRSEDSVVQRVVVVFDAVVARILVAS
jgi:hypothetical protein